MGKKYLIQHEFGIGYDPDLQIMRENRRFTGKTLILGKNRDKRLKRQLEKQIRAAEVQRRQHERDTKEA